MSRLFGGIVPGVLGATLVGVISGIYTFGPALQEESDRKSFAMIHEQEKAEQDLGPEMLEVVPVLHNDNIAAAFGAAASGAAGAGAGAATTPGSSGRDGGKIIGGREREYGRGCDGMEERSDGNGYRNSMATSALALLEAGKKASRPPGE